MSNDENYELVINQVLSDMRRTLSSMFDELGEFYLTDVRRERDQDHPDLFVVYYEISAPAYKFNYHRMISFTIRVTPYIIQYPSSGYCPTLGTKFNLTKRDIDSKLFHINRDDITGGDEDWSHISI